jgi:uncharacterized peroxidase-related enzyme
MAWIQTIDPDDATGELAEIYGAIAGARGGVANVHRAQSLNPRAIRAHLELYKAVVFARSSLSRPARERIAVVVSHANRCAYCVAHHGESLRQLGESPALVEALAQGEIPADLGEGDAALLSWARKATSRPADCSEDDLAALRRHGFDDRALLDASLTVAYFCFVNRLVLLLGVDVEADYARTCGDADVP